MPILCLEGASAIGKTSTCRELEKSYNAYIVPEVNKLFQRPSNATQLWYFEKQIQRWRIANEMMSTHELVVFDGDPLQPLWYNWCYDFIGWQPLSDIIDFFRSYLVKEEFGFPDAYIILHASESELRTRKENDIINKRGKFETHLQFIHPQARYFNNLNELVPGYVRNIKAISVEHNVSEIIRLAPSLMKIGHSIKSVDLFDSLVEWIRTNKANLS